MVAEIDRPLFNKDLKTYIVKSGIFLRDAKNRRTYHVGRVEYSVLSTFDGKHTIDELKAINSRYMNEKQLEEFVFYSYVNGLLEQEEKIRKRVEVFKLRKSLCCPMRFLHEGLLTRILRLLLIVGSIFSLAALTYFISTRSSLIFQTIFNNNYLQGIHILYYFLSVFIVGFFHELGHAIMIIASGGNVFELGVMLNYFHPAFYVDITGIEQIRSKRSRIGVWIAGVMSQLILALPAMLLTFHEHSPLYLNGFLIILNIINISMMIFNLLFVIKLDGYYILCELLGTRSLRERAISSIWNGFTKQEAEGTRGFDFLILKVIGLICLTYLPLFLMQIVLTCTGHFFPKMMPYVNRILLVWLFALCTGFLVRIIVLRIRGQRNE